MSVQRAGGTATAENSVCQQTPAVNRLALSTHSQDTTLSKKERKRQKDNQEKSKNEELINTARSVFPSDLEVSYHMQSNINRDKNNDTSFIAQSKFVPVQGVTVRLENGAVLRHQGRSSRMGEETMLTAKEYESN